MRRLFRSPRAQRLGVPDTFRSQHFPGHALHYERVGNTTLARSSGNLPLVSPLPGIVGVGGDQRCACLALRWSGG